MKGHGIKKRFEVSYKIEDMKSIGIKTEKDKEEKDKTGKERQKKEKQDWTGKT